MSLTFGAAKPRRPWDPRRPHAARYWSVAELDVLKQHYGAWTNDAIADAVHRTPVAVAVKAMRLHLGARDSFLTARQVAAILGVESHTPARWARIGLMTMTLTDRVTAHGTARIWACDPEDLEFFLRDYPEMVAWRRVEEGYWRNIARQAHARADFLTLAQAADVLGVSEGMVRQHCRKGWLPYVRAPKLDRGGRRRILIRRRALAQFRPRKPGGIGHPGRYHRGRAA